MYGVNVGVPKTLVRHLVAYCANTCSESEKVLQEVLLDVLDTPVSPELLPPEDGKISQKTEDLVGPYELHDFFLYQLLRCGFGPAKIYRLACRAFEGIYSKETIGKWLKTFAAASLHSSLSVRACRTDRKSEVSRYRRGETFGCLRMRAAWHGRKSWISCRNKPPIGCRIGLRWRECGAGQSPGYAAFCSAASIACSRSCDV